MKKTGTVCNKSGTIQSGTKKIRETLRSNINRYWDSRHEVVQKREKQASKQHQSENASDGVRLRFRKQFVCLFC